MGLVDCCCIDCGGGGGDGGFVCCCCSVIELGRIKEVFDSLSRNKDGLGFGGNGGTCFLGPWDEVVGFGLLLLLLLTGRVSSGGGVVTKGVLVEGVSFSDLLLNNLILAETIPDAGEEGEDIVLLVQMHWPKLFDYYCYYYCC